VSLVFTSFFCFVGVLLRLFCDEREPFTVFPLVSADIEIHLCAGGGGYGSTVPINFAGTGWFDIEFVIAD